jgi:hypothetical protein
LRPQVVCPAKALAERALAGLPTGSPGWLRAQDIQFVADQRDEDGDEFTEPVDQAAIDWRNLEGARGYEAPYAASLAMRCAALGCESLTAE